ncbi:hypothetical protein FH972_006508 [Carpinus fangiana]|uniref:Trafficking protein particle complex subunit 6B n=1 Tax=Carpinus fangiana TaxID=176857 RepID=A0A5N6QSI0_9ROSI|nr:hypothetical protein FH972_006508 [Carpinus fangiana]
MVSSYCDPFYANKPELAARRIEAIGFQVGHQLSEWYTMERPWFSDHLEAIKFICKDFWSKLFKKQIDNLKTNHRGTFVLQDNRFRWLARMSVDPSSEAGDLSQENSAGAPENKAAQATSMHLYFPCGIIRGALSNLGIPCAVSADISNLPACEYTMERPWFSDHLEAIKFICKDFWSKLFKKQIDNLKTNHRGTFVLQDNRFRWLARMSVDPSSEAGDLSQENSAGAPENKAAQATSMHLYFPCGIIRGALSNLGIPCAVSADISNLPACE